MKKRISVVVLATMFAAGSAMASGYRIPEQSLDSTAKAGANIASASSADTTYYNPAGMVFMDDAWHLEGTATYLHLTSIDYDDDRGDFFSGESEEENFFLPTFFAVSPDYNNFRFGFSFTPSYGLSKRWTDDAYPQAFAQKASLKVFEFNPTVAYKFSDMFSVGGGVRMIYAKATLMNNPSDLTFLPARDRTALQLSGDTTEWGYNLAMDFKPSDSLNFALTYRSNIDLDFDDGDVYLYPLGMSPYAVKMEGSTSLPAPAVLAFSTAYTFNNWTFDLTIDQTFWSEYEDLTLEFEFLPTQVIDKDWDDTTAVRLGVEYKLDEAITLMGGIAYDENPVPDDTLGFELPDSDAWLFSAGVRFAHSENLEYGVAVLYDYKESRDESNLADGGRVNGEFTNASAWLVSFGLSYKF